MDNYLSKSPVKEFPLDGVVYEQLQPEKRTLVKKILYTFVYYASKSSKHTYQELHENYFMEMMIEIWKVTGWELSRRKPAWKQLQILYFSKGCKNGLFFKNFLDQLTALAYNLEPKSSPQDSLKFFLTQLMQLYDTKLLPQLNGKVVNCKEIVAQDTRDFLTKLKVDLLKLYKVYFSHEVIQKGGKKNVKKQSFEAFCEFLKDFQVFPKIVSARDIFYIFNQACDSAPSDLLYQSNASRAVITEYGSVFKFSKFIDSLIVLSKRVFFKLKQIENQQQWEGQQKYILRTLLEYMETVKSSTKRKTKYKLERFCLIVLQEHPEQQEMKTIQARDRQIHETISNLDFFNLIDKIIL